MNIYFFIFACSLSGLLFGYDAGIISGALPYIKKEFLIPDSRCGIIVALLPIGALLGAIIVGRLSDLYGRKIILISSALLYILGAFQSAMAGGVFALLCGRFMLGVAVGASSALAPLYICEISQEKQRGMLVTLYLVAINLGILLSYIMNVFFMQEAMWRTLMLVSVLPAIILAVCSYILPESPRWLMFNGKQGGASAILIKLHGAKKALKIMQEMTALLTAEKKQIKTIFHRQYLKIILIAIMVAVLSQAVGIGAVVYYAPTILLETGLSTAMASMAVTVGVGVAYVISAFIASRLIDYLGRRRLLLMGLLGIVFSLFFMTWVLRYVDNTQWLGMLTLFCLIVFLFFQGTCLAPAAILVPIELFPLPIRGMGMSIVITCNWLANALVLFLFPLLLHHLGLSASFMLFLTMSVVGFFICYFWVPETKGASLEQIEYHVLRDSQKAMVFQNSLSGIIE